MLSPTLATPSPPSFNVPTFASVIDGLATIGVLVLPGAETSGPLGGEPKEVAVLSTLPASISLAVSV